MKLLNPQQLRDDKSADIAREALRINELNKEAQKARLNLANTQADFNETLAKNRALWAREEEEHLANIKARRDELKVLEARRQKALEPLRFQENELNARQQGLQLAFEAVKRREGEIEDLKVLLEDRLDALGAREQDVLEREVRVELREDGVERQGNEARQRAQALTDAMNKFVADMEKAKANLEEKKTALALWDTQLNAKQEKLKLTEAELGQIARRLEDQRGTLERAMKRISP